jgi:hypothetical protein
MKIRQDIISFLKKSLLLLCRKVMTMQGLLPAMVIGMYRRIISLDATEEVIEEAIAKKCNLIVAHHPIVFRGLKKITGKNYVEQTIISSHQK